MAKYNLKFMPMAIYLDTNILRNAGFDLSQSWMIELRAFAKDLSMKLNIPELVLDEWTKIILDELNLNRNNLLSAARFLGDYNVILPDFDESEARLPEWISLKEIIRGRLEDSGFEIIENWSGNMDQLISEALCKFPPFVKGDKGFCDAIILESIILHASRFVKDARIMVISNDKGVRSSDKRFAKYDINVTFADGSDVIEKLKTSLDDETAELQKYNERLLFDFVKGKEDIIIEFIKKAPLKFTDSWLQSFGDNRISGTVESVLRVKPARVSKVVGGVQYWQTKTLPGRYPVDIWVATELDVLVHDLNIYGTFYEPRAIEVPENINEQTPLDLENRFYWPPRTVKQTITRDVHIEATVNEEGVESGDFEDLKLESVR